MTAAILEQVEPVSIGTRRPSGFQRAANTMFVTLLQGLPLFRKDLIEQSSRTRTFVLRVVLAIVLFATALLYAAARSNSALLGAAFQLAGQGQHLLDGLWGLLLVYIYLYVPANACGAIASERQRMTLPLLYLTRLGPWHIIIEKMLARIVPMLHVMLLSLPLLAIANSFGGVTFAMLGAVIWFLVVTTIQVAAISVSCSAFCRHPFHALVSIYVVLAVVNFGPTICDNWITDGKLQTTLQRWFSLEALNARLATAGTGTNSFGATGTYLSNLAGGGAAFQPSIPAELVLFAMFPPSLLNHHLTSAQSGWAFSWNSLFVAGIPSLACAALSLFIGRFGVYRELTEHRTSGIRELLTWLDSKIWIRGPGCHSIESVHLQPDASDLPGDQPIAWRGLCRGFWSHTRNWLILLMVLLVPTMAVALTEITTSRPDTGPISFMIFVLWLISAWLLASHTSTLLNTERHQQTLELLLTTPISSEDIIRQKIIGTNRLMWLCAVPLLTCILFQTWWRSELTIPGSMQPPGFTGVEYLLTATACVVVHFRLIAWTSMWMGLRFRSSAKATIAALTFVVGMSALPILVFALPIALFVSLSSVWLSQYLGMLLIQISPAIMIAYIELCDLQYSHHFPFLPLILHVALYTGATIYVKDRVLTNADLFLGRVEYY